MDRWTDHISSVMNIQFWVESGGGEGGWTISELFMIYMYADELVRVHVFTRRLLLMAFNQSVIYIPLAQVQRFRLE